MVRGDQAFTARLPAAKTNESRFRYQQIAFVDVSGLNQPETLTSTGFMSHGATGQNSFRFHLLCFKAALVLTHVAVCPAHRVIAMDRSKWGSDNQVAFNWLELESWKTDGLPREQCFSGQF